MPQVVIIVKQMNVFLSYAKSDEPIAQKIRSQLVYSGMNVWDESQEILPGDNWARKIGEALEKSEAMIVLLSPDAMKSTSVRHEIDFALVSARYKNRLIPVLVRPTKEIPWILGKMQMLRLTNDTEEISRQILARLKSRDTAQSQASI